MAHSYFCSHVPTASAGPSQPCFWEDSIWARTRVSYFVTLLSTSYTRPGEEFLCLLWPGLFFHLRMFLWISSPLCFIFAIANNKEKIWPHLPEHSNSSLTAWGLFKIMCFNGLMAFQLKKITISWNGGLNAKIRQLW